MKRYLIIANTYYQLFVAIQMKLCVLNDDYVVLALSDHTSNADSVAKRLERQKIFEKVIFFLSKDVRNNRKCYQRISDIFKVAFYKQNRFGKVLDCLEGTENKYFDEIVCYNMVFDIYGLFAELIRYNDKIRISILEEGPLSYNVLLKQSRGQMIVNFLWKIQGKRTIDNILRDFYCMYPSLYHGTLNAIQVPSLSGNGKFADIIKEMFDMKHVELNYTEKFIFFTGVYDFEGNNYIGEFELVCRVADIVGKNNMLIKMHPRDTRDVYHRCGFKVDRNSGIPWEAIQLARDFKDKVFLTVNSTSVLAGSFLSNNSVKTLYLFRLCNAWQNDLARKVDDTICDLIRERGINTILNNVVIADKIEDILS